MALDTSFGCAINQRAGIPLLQWAAWLRAGILHGITTREGGVSQPPWDTLNLSADVGDDPAAVRINRIKLAAALGDMKRPVVFANQVHGARVARIDAPPGASFEADGLITDKRDLFIAVLVADCVPILFLDAAKLVVGVAHAGWRGLAEDVPGTVVRAMRDEYGSIPSDIQAAVGPHIGPCCYTVGPEVADIFRDIPRAVKEDDPLRLDLGRIAKRRLADAGLLPENVQISSPCTACFSDAYFSHRNQNPTGRFAAVIGIGEPWDA